MNRLLGMVTVVLLAAGCAAPGPEGEARNRTATGAVIGAVGGAVVGHQVDPDRGAIVGAVVGGATGAAIGRYMDEQERAFNEALAEERRQNEIEVERVSENLLKLTLDSEVSFDFDSAAIKPTFRPSLDKLATVLTRYGKTDVMVVGHTDSIGSEAYNQLLSERRAEATANYLVSQGVERSRLRTQGSGETQPRATNATAGGRQLNRRVEVFVEPDPQAIRASEVVPRR